MTRLRAEATDEMLMVRYQRGDREAFAHLVRRHAASVFTFAARWLGSADLGEQATERTFLTVVSRAAEFKHEARFLAWLFGIARSQCVEQHRERSPVPKEPGDGSFSAAGTGSAPSRPAGRVVRTLGELPVDQREALLLKEIAQLPFADIATITETQPEVVRTRLGHALEKVHRAVADSEDYARSLR